MKSNDALCRFLWLSPPTLFIKVLFLEKMMKKETIMNQKEQLLYSSLRNKLTKRLDLFAWINYAQRTQLFIWLNLTIDRALTTWVATSIYGLYRYVEIRKCVSRIGYHFRENWSIDWGLACEWGLATKPPFSRAWIRNSLPQCALTWRFHQLPRLIEDFSLD